MNSLYQWHTPFVAGFLAFVVIFVIRGLRD